MKKIFQITGILFGLAAIVAFAGPEKKMEKLVSKVWKNQEVKLHELELSDTLAGEVTRLCEVKNAHGETLGYACYATAFGCRVGGCAAPSDPNIQSYETFDYIVVYDADLNIQKVDIAEYGGQYGYEICRAKWLAQFVGKTTGFKLNDNIDGITGATVSAQFLIDDLNAVGTLLKTVDLNALSASTD